MKFASLAHKKLFALGLTTVAAGSLAVGTMLSSALFTDTKTDDSTFTVGTILLDGTKITAMDLTTAAMMPGDATTGMVEVKNIGTAQLRYAVSQTCTTADSLALYSELQATVKDHDTTGNTCTAFDGTSLHAAAVLGASGNLVGDPTSGGQAGDRTLNAGASDFLCFRVALPLAASSSVQGATTTTTFSFAAEQTANNP
jgi:predicted ribosomally synthesized peptide with SipW-like signal peptide